MSKKKPDEQAAPNKRKINARRTKQRKCRICGCTDEDCRQCIEKTGFACHWVEEDLCSACNINTMTELMTALDGANNVKSLHWDRDTELWTIEYIDGLKPDKMRADFLIDFLNNG